MTYALATGISRHRAAYSGTQDGSKRRKRHPRGTRFGRVEAWAYPRPRWGWDSFAWFSRKTKKASARDCRRRRRPQPHSANDASQSHPVEIAQTWGSLASNQVNLTECPRAQAVNATHSRNFSAGERNFSVFRGR
jgi:hypothetical protein